MNARNGNAMNEQQDVTSSGATEPNLPNRDITPRSVVDDAKERAFREPSESVGRTIELEIGELSIRGYSSRDRARIDTAFREELQRILADTFGDAAMSDVDISVADIGAITIPRGMRPEAVGVHVARVIGKRLG
jgi:hypothetical protein